MRILVDFQGGWGLGDLLCAEPMVRALAAAHGPGRPEIRVGGRSGELLHHPLVAGEAPPGWPADLVVPVRLFTHMPMEEYARLEALHHLVDHMCAYAGLPAPDRKPRIHLTDRERERARFQPLEKRTGSPLVALCTDAVDPYRHWPRERWLPVISHLLARRARIIEIGLQPALGVGIDLCGGRLTMREVAAVLEQCDLFVGHNTGTFHYAQAVGTPCVILFSLARPSRFIHAGARVTSVQARLPCIDCMTRDMAARVRNGCPHHPPGACMAAIDPAMVIEALDKALAVAPQEQGCLFAPARL